MANYIHESCYNYLSAEDKRHRFPNGYCTNHNRGIDDDIPCIEWKENIQHYIFTFGSGHEHPGRFIRIKAKDWMSARLKMIELYGTGWAFQYDEKKWHDIKVKSISHGIPFETQWGNTIDITGAGPADDGTEATE